MILLGPFPHPLIARGPATLPFGRAKGRAQMLLLARPALPFGGTGPSVTRQQRAGSLLNAIWTDRCVPSLHVPDDLSDHAGHPKSHQRHDGVKGRLDLPFGSCRVKAYPFYTCHLTTATVLYPCSLLWTRPKHSRLSRLTQYRD
jgi:hypothetical protein